MPMQNINFRGLHGHGHFQQGLLGGIILHDSTHCDSHPNLHNVLNRFLEIVKFSEDEEFANTVLSCYLSMDLLCHGTSVAW